MKGTIVLLVIAGGLCIHTLQVFAGDDVAQCFVVEQYKEHGTSGPFRYAVYNNRWLLHGQGWFDEKYITRVAITGVLPGTRGEIVIPPSIAGHEVYGIDKKAFESCMGVTSILIPSTVRFLRPGTFNRCQGLINIIVAAEHPKLASVDGVMFDKQKTTLLAFGSGRAAHYTVPDTTTAIGQGAFSLCASLKSISIPEGVIDIGGRRGEAFLGCSNLERINIPQSSRYPPLSQSGLPPEVW